MNTNIFLSKLDSILMQWRILMFSGPGNGCNYMIGVVERIKLIAKMPIFAMPDRRGTPWLSGNIFNTIVFCLLACKKSEKF